MMLKKTFFSAMLLALVGLQVAWADAVLFDWGFNVNGQKYLLNSPDPSIPSVDQSGLPSAMDQSGFNWATGLGSFNMVLDPGIDGHYFTASFLDYDIDENASPLGWADDQGSINGSTDSRLTYEIDEPGYTFGDIYNHLLNYDGYTSTFDNSVFNGNNNLIEDVSTGMGWNFDLSSNQYATITFDVATTAPVDGFYLKQWNATTDNPLYFSSNLAIGTHEPQSVPEPSEISLILCGLVALLSFYRGIRKCS